MKLTLTKEIGISQLENIDNLADDGEVNEIEAFDVIDMFPQAKGTDVLRGWIAKLAHKGTISLSCIDLIHMAKMISMRIVSVSLANQTLYLNDGSRKAAYCGASMKEFLELCGLKVMKNRTFQGKVYIVAQRP